jgi:hypothetical protein
MASKRQALERNRKASKSNPVAGKPVPRVEYIDALPLPFLIQPAVVGVIDMKLGPRAVAWGRRGDCWMEGVDFHNGKPYFPCRLVIFGGEGADRELARRRYVGHVLRTGTVWRKRSALLDRFEMAHRDDEDPREVSVDQEGTT